MTKTKSQLLLIFMVFALSCSFFLSPRPVKALTIPTYVRDSVIEIPSSQLWYMDIDSQGRLYVCDVDADIVAIYSRTGTLLGNITADFNFPTGVAVYGDKVYVVDNTNDNLSIFQNSVLINSTTVAAPYDVAVDSHGTLYVTSNTNSRVEIYSPSLTLTNKLEGIDTPQGIDVGPDGRIFVNSVGDSNVTVFSPDYSVLGYIGEYGTGPGQFNRPYGVDVNIDGYVFVADFDLDRVQVFSPSLQLVSVINGVDGALGVKTDGTGRLYAGAWYDHNVTIFQTDDLGDKSAPDISEVVINPANPIAGQPVNISAEITDYSGVGLVTLTYSFAGGNATTVPMTANGDNYLVTLAGFPSNGTVEFYITAKDQSLDQHTSTSSTYTFNVISQSQAQAESLFGVDPSLIATAGLAVAAIAVVFALFSLKRKP
ncbi:MAG: NHL repeat-containing protein [Candidatus Ranarchaeia archaeon]